MSKTRNRTKPTASVGSVSGKASTDSVMPATSSITMAPGSLRPSTRSARPAAQMPASVTTTQNRTTPRGENGTSQRTAPVSALPTVPGATGTQPAPPAVARTSATRSSGAARLSALADELVPLDLDDPDALEAARRDGPVTQVDDAVDLGRLAGRAPFEGERGVLARPVHEHLVHRAQELAVPLPLEAIVKLLDDRRPLRSEEHT